MSNERLREMYYSLTEEQLEIIDEYCADNLKKLKKVCFFDVRKACVDSNMDEDDLYGIAMEELAKSVYNYDASKGKLKTFLGNSIRKKINSYIRDTKYTYKRSNIQKDSEGKKVHVSNMSLNELTEEGINLSEKIASDFKMENCLSEEMGFSIGEQMNEYLNNLSKRQREIVLLLSRGYSKKEIIKLLHINNKIYTDCMLGIRSYENTKML